MLKNACNYTGQLTKGFLRDAFQVLQRTHTKFHPATESPARSPNVVSKYTTYGGQHLPERSLVRRELLEAMMRVDETLIPNAPPIKRKTLRHNHKVQFSTADPDACTHAASYWPKQPGGFGEAGRKGSLCGLTHSISLTHGIIIPCHSMPFHAVTYATHSHENANSPHVLCAVLPRPPVCWRQTRKGPQRTEMEPNSMHNPTRRSDSAEIK